MAAPPKPWESPGVNRQQNTIGNTINNLAGASPGGANLPPCCQPGAGGAPPTLPTRPGSQTGMVGSRFGSGYSSYSPYSSQMGMYSSPYSSLGSSYGYGGYGGMGGYGGYGGYGNYGYNRMGPEDYNSFSRHAEENSRQAFQSIESIVNAFTSVSMMLDSTFQAVYNSFRAVIGVADNFSRLKLQLSQVFSAFALFRTLRYLYRKLLVLLKLRPQGYAEEAWTEASDVVEQLAAKDPKKTSWPIFLFFGIILGAPWLIWKLISKMTDPSSGNSWANGEDDHFVARAEFDFKADSQEEISFKAGQEIAVAPKEIQPKVKGWLLASVDGKKVGLIPANYVKVLGKKRGRKYLQEVQQPLESNTQAPAPQHSCCKGESKPTENKQQGSCCGTQAEPNMESVFQSTSPAELTQTELTPAQPSMDPVFQGTSQAESEPTMEPAIPRSPQSEMSAEDILGENDHEM